MTERIGNTLSTAVGLSCPSTVARVGERTGSAKLTFGRGGASRLERCGFRVRDGACDGEGGRSSSVLSL